MAIVLVLLVAEIVSAFETTAVYVAIPRFMEAFGSDAAQTSWAITIFLLVAAASAAICGRIGDMLGRKRVLIFVLLASTVGSLVSLSTGDLTGVIIGRGLQGIAGAILPLCFGIAREALPAKHVPVACSVIAGSALIAGAAGTLSSGALLDVGDWQLIFVLPAVLSVLAALLAAVILPRSQRSSESGRIDWIGGLLFSPAIAAILFGVTQSRSWGWSSPGTLIAILGGLAALLVWFWWELRTPSPMINVRLFFQHKLLLTVLATAATAIGPIGAIGFVQPLVMQSPTSAPVGLGLSTTMVGVLGFIVSMVAFSLSPVSGRISAAVGARRSLMIGAVLNFVGIAAIAATHKHLILFVLSTAVMGIGTTFVYTALPNLIVEAVPEENTSEATGVQVVTRTLFQGISSSIAGLLLASDTVPGTPFGTEDAYFKVFALIGAGAVVTFVIAFFIKGLQPVAAAATGTAGGTAAADRDDPPVAADTATGTVTGTAAPAKDAP